MNPQNQSSCVSCEVGILRAKNTDMIKSDGELFVRCYLSNNNSRVRIDTHQISSDSNLFIWNQTFSLNCSSSSSGTSTSESIETLKQGSVVFELRWRSTATFMSRINGSKVLGKAEIPWETVAESKGMQVEKWLVMLPQKGRRRAQDLDFKPPAVQVAMRIHESGSEAINSTRINKRSNETRSEEEYSCGCCMVNYESRCNSCCVGYEYFAIEAALEAAY